MKILMIAPTPFLADRGCHVRIYEEANAIQRLGFKVKIVTYHLGSTPDKLDVERIPKLIFWYKKLDAGPSLWKILLDLLLVIKVCRLLSKSKYDVIHAHLHEGVFVAFIAKILVGSRIPVIFDYQGSMTEEIVSHNFTKNKFIVGWLRGMEDRVNKFADCIICSSSAGFQSLRSRYNIPANKLVLIRDGIGSGLKTETNKVAALKKRYKISARERIVIYLGLLNQYQGVDILLKSFKIVAKRFDNVRLFVMGYPNVDYYRKIVNKMGLEKRVILTGKIRYFHIQNYLALGDVAVSAKISKTEANGKLYNYIASGMPIVVFDSAVNREILGNSGVYAEFGEYSDFANKIIYCIDNYQKCLKVSRSYKAKMRRQLSWSVSAKRLVNVYKQIRISK